MHAYLLITNNSEKINKYAKKFGDEIIYEELVKISDIKQHIKDTNLKLLKKTVFVINNFDKASVQAQNAFLKRLEEPQEKLIYVLTAVNEDKILPTILSRVQVKRFAKNNIKNIKNYSEFFNKDINYKFSIIDKITNREDATKFLEELIETARKKSVKNIEVVSNALSAIKANGNSSLQLANMVVGINTHRG